MGAILRVYNRLRYAGWLGTVGARYKVDGAISEDMPSIEESYHRLAAVAGTSTCHLVQVLYCPR